MNPRVSIFDLLLTNQHYISDMLNEKTFVPIDTDSNQVAAAEAR